MHSLAISEQNNDELEAANDLQNSMQVLYIEWKLNFSCMYV